MARKSTRRGSSAPTIADVAARAGVSPMTVSRVINDEPRVRSETRETVKAAIEALGYAPNAAARSLAGADQVRIGLLYSNPSAAFLSEFLVGVLDQASRSDLQLVIEKCELGMAGQAAAERLTKGRVEGVLLTPPLSNSPEVLATLLAENLPIVLVATAEAPPGVSSAVIDDRAAAHAMTAHLLALGHHRIGFICGNPNQTASDHRLAGYRDALAEEGLAADETLIAQGLFTYRSGLDAAEHLLALPERPSAIFASNDDMAAATVAVAHRHAIDVPGDLTVCGFDDTAIATTIWPELTTIRQPIAEMSRAALDLVAAEVRDRRSGISRPAERRLLDFALIRRQSDAAPRRRRPVVIADRG